MVHRQPAVIGIDEARERFLRTARSACSGEWLRGHRDSMLMLALGAGFAAGAFPGCRRSLTRELLEVIRLCILR